MLGDLVAHLDRPEVAADVLASLDDGRIEATIRQQAAANNMTVADCVAEVVRDFLDRADDDAWLQLVGIMGRAENPGLAALGAILRQRIGELRSAAAR